MSALSYPAFLERLRETQSEEWGLTRSGAIRMTEWPFCCPITAIRHEAPSVWAYAARGIGLNEETRDRIVLAADNAVNDPLFDPGVRADLLAACGLTERAE